MHVCAHLSPETVQLEEAAMKSQSFGWESYYHSLDKKIQSYKGFINTSNQSQKKYSEIKENNHFNMFAGLRVSALPYGCKKV